MTPPIDPIARAIRALEPFSQDAGEIAEAEAECGIPTPDDMSVEDASIAGTPLTVGDLRRARKAYRLLKEMEGWPTEAQVEAAARALARTEVATLIEINKDALEREGYIADATTILRAALTPAASPPPGDPLPSTEAW